MVTLVAQHANQLSGQGVVEQPNNVVTERAKGGRDGAIVKIFLGRTQRRHVQ